MPVKMKLTICFLALAGCALALPANVPFEIPDEIDLSKLVPNNLYLEPNNPVDPADLPEGRIIGGQEVSRNSVPYQAALIINGLGFCGGSLISTNRILTAAHCTSSAVFVLVRLGAHAFNTNEATQIRVTSTSIINHPNFDQGGFAANDVAIVLLSSPVVTNNNVGVISLAPATAGNFAGSTAFLSGWGRTSDASNAVAAVLHGVQLNIITNAACALAYGNNVLASTICTSGAGRVGACNGDSGGPLVVGELQVGVVSFGSTQCEAGNPTAYARVTSFRTWIAQNAGV